MLPLVLFFSLLTGITLFSEEIPAQEGPLDKFQEKLISQIFFAAGEKFNLSDWEDEGKTKEPKTNENGEEEIQFISDLKEDCNTIAYESISPSSTGQNDLQNFVLPSEESAILPQEQPSQPQRIPEEPQESSPSQQNSSYFFSEMLPEPKEHFSPEVIQKSTDPSPQDLFVQIFFDQAGHPGFYVKSTKVSNKEYQKFVKAINHRHPSHWAEGKIPMGLEDSPVVNVSYKDAFLFAVWSGKRLPTKNEIERAAKLGYLSNEEYAPLEWTSTPTPIQEKKYLRSGSLQMGQTVQLRHHIFGGTEEFALPNQEFNHQIGFRLAADGY